MAVLRCIWWNVQTLRVPATGDTASGAAARFQAVVGALRAAPGGTPHLVMLCEATIPSGGEDDVLRQLAGSLGETYRWDYGGRTGAVCGLIWDSVSLDLDPSDATRRALHDITREASDSPLGRPVAEYMLTHKGSGTDFRLLLNHWTSRAGDAVHGAAARAVFGGFLWNRMQELLVRPRGGPDQMVVVVGDFNEEPFGEPLTNPQRFEDRLYVSRDRTPVLNRGPGDETALLYNPTWRLLGEVWTRHQEMQAGREAPAGTHWWGEKRLWRTYDQVLVSGAMLREPNPTFEEESLCIHFPPCLLDSSGVPTSVSDHLPLCFNLHFH